MKCCRRTAVREHFPVRCTPYIYGVSQRATLVVVEAVETGGCPHAAIREDISANLAACESLTARHATDFLLLESGGDNLAANFSRELADLTIYVIDVAGGDKVPRKGGPGVTQSDIFVINKVSGFQPPLSVIIHNVYIHIRRILQRGVPGNAHARPI
jgi:hypothetical protein